MFDPATQTILQGFLPGSKPNVVGSMKNQGDVRYSSDIDQFQSVRVNSALDAVKIVKQAIHTLSSLRNVRVTEIKWADRNMSPRAFLRFSNTELASALRNHGGRVKLDAVAWLQSRYQEFSCVYEFITQEGSLNPLEPHLKSLRADIKELEKEGAWFKVLKRLAALARAEGKSTQAFTDFFRSDYGTLYSVLSDVTTLANLKHVPPAKLREELDGLMTRLGGVRLHDPRLRVIIHQLRRGKWAQTIPLLEKIVNGAARAWMKK